MMKNGKVMIEDKWSDNFSGFFNTPNFRSLNPEEKLYNALWHSWFQYENILSSTPFTGEDAIDSDDIKSIDLNKNTI